MASKIKTVTETDFVEIVKALRVKDTDPSTMTATVTALTATYGTEADHGKRVESSREVLDGETATLKGMTAVRDAYIESMHKRDLIGRKPGQTQGKDIAVAAGVTPARVSQIVSAMRDRAAQSAAVKAVSAAYADQGRDFDAKGGQAAAVREAAKGDGTRAGRKAADAAVAAILADVTNGGTVAPVVKPTDWEALTGLVTRLGDMLDAAVVSSHDDRVAVARLAKTLAAEAARAGSMA